MATMLSAYEATVNQDHDIVLSITNGQYVVVYGGCTGSGGQTGAATASILSGSGLTLSKITERAPAAGSSSVAAAWGGFATATGSVTVRIHFSAAPANGFTYAEAHASVDTGSPILGIATPGDGVTASTPALTLTATPTVNQTVRGLFVMRNKVVAASAATGTLVATSGNQSTPVAGMLIEGGTGLTGTAVSCTTQGSAYNAGIAFIINTTAAAGIAGDCYVWDGSSLATSPQGDPYVWDGSTLIASDVSQVV